MADQPKPEGKAPTAPAAHKPPPPPPQAPSTPWESELTRMLQERFGDQILEFTTQLG